jgi:hypothetical protein
VSAVPPGENGATIFTARSGQSARALAAAKQRKKASDRSMSGSLSSKGAIL